MPSADAAVVRRPAVAGYFYPAEPAALAHAVQGYARSGHAAEDVLAIIVPHGSYRHAGAVMGAVFGRIRIPRRCILIGPSHTGSWMPWSLLMRGAYRTPLGDVPVDTRCAEALRARCDFLEPDAWSQRGEHAIEVLLPFLQQLGPADLRIVPIISSAADEAQQSCLAQALAQVIRMQEEPVLLIASADLSHYVSRQDGAWRDQRILDAVKRLESRAVIEQARADATVMCGDGAIAMVLEAANHLGAARAEVVAYQSSADAGADPDSATGYAGVLIR